MPTYKDDFPDWEAEQWVFLTAVVRPITPSLLPTAHRTPTNAAIVLYIFAACVYFTSINHPQPI